MCGYAISSRLEDYKSTLSENPTCIRALIKKKGFPIEATHLVFQGKTQ